MSRLGNRTPQFPPAVLVNEHIRHMTELATGVTRVAIHLARLDEAGTHPETYMEHECRFAAKHIHSLGPSNILDIGSYRQFLYGLLAHYSVTTVDVRSRPRTLQNECTITCDAKCLPLSDDEFDAVTTLCALEHFGLGRYGDQVDPFGDRKAFGEMVRVLKPGGLLIFTTTINGRTPAVVFNAHRIYTHDMIRNLCAGLMCVEEAFFGRQKNRSCSLAEVTEVDGEWDVYLGCWKKPD